MANPSLPSFVELMASLGLQDEHAANALLRGGGGGVEDVATTTTATTPATPATAINATKAPSTEQTVTANPYRQSTASLESSGTPLSSASLVTPLSSPSVQQQQQRERPTSHGKKRYSPYGLSAAVNYDPRDMYARRGSVPDILSQNSYERRLHHLSAPEPFHDHSGSNSGRVTDEDGDEEMEDASSNRPYKSPTGSTNVSPTVHCVGQPNLLISRQRMSSRPGGGGQPGMMPRTKSYSHMRTTSIGASQRPISRPPLPTSPRVEMPMDTERSNDADGDIAVVSISSLLRRSHSSTQQQQQQQSRPTPPTLSLDSPRGYQFPPVPTIPPPQPPTVSDSSSTRSTSSSLRAPPSAPHTKTSFGFLPGASLSGTNALSLSAARRARHARSSSARSVRDMIRERESNVLLAPLHSFHPMGETEEETEGVGSTNNGGSSSLKPPVAEARIRHRSTGQMVESSSSSTTTTKTSASTNANAIPGPSVDRGNTPPTMSTLGSRSFLPLDDTSRSFSHRRRVKRHTADPTSSSSSSVRTGKRSSPPPPLMLPTLPINVNIRALVDRDAAAAAAAAGGSEKDRLSVGGASSTADTGYVSRREPHSPDPRGSWRRRMAPLEVAGV